MGGGGFPQGAGLAGWAVGGGGPIINARPGRREADHQRKALEAGTFDFSDWPLRCETRKVEK